MQHTKTTQTNNPFAYTAREFDTDELYYYRARYYDPTTQRFLSLDPIGFNSGDFNFYRYVGNLPVNFNDPLGLKCGDDGVDKIRHYNERQCEALKLIGLNCD